MGLRDFTIKFLSWDQSGIYFAEKSIKAEKDLFFIRFIPSVTCKRDRAVITKIPPFLII
jgi:hypothetical protein